MASFASDPNVTGFWTSTLWKWTTSPLALVLLATALVCLVARVWTEFQNKQQSLSKAEPKEIAVLPYWIPWLGHAVQFATRFQNFLEEASKTTRDGVFYLILAGTVHNIVLPPSVTKQVLLQRSTITSNDFTFRILEKFFGNDGSLRNMDPALILGKVHQVMFQFNREPFVSTAAASTVKLLQERTHNLVSFCSSWVDQSIWERGANIRVDPSGTSAEASFFPLMRYFVGDIACTILMGQDFVTNNPTILPDLFTFDGSFHKFLVGLPSWFPGMPSAYTARNRVVEAVRKHQEALYAIWDDRDPGSAWDDMSDVSDVMQNRAREWRNMNATPILYAPCDTALLWAINANANQIIFWVLWHIYRQPDLRAQILQEMAPFATLKPVKSDLPIPEPPSLNIDLDGLLHDCPLLKATFFETMRLESPSTSYKAVTESFNITESAEDAALNGKAQAQTYKFKKGTYICIPHGVHSMDGRYWKDPKTFNPRRFFVTKNDEKTPNPSKTTVDMGSMKAFGGGATMCKGRIFAEREVLVFVAAVLTCWDVEPVGGKWSDPGRVMGSGAYAPRRDVRVRLGRREVK